MVVDYIMACDYVMAADYITTSDHVIMGRGAARRGFMQQHQQVIFEVPEVVRCVQDQA